MESKRKKTRQGTNQLLSLFRMESAWRNAEMKISEDFRVTAIYVVRREDLTHFGVWSIPPSIDEFGKSKKIQENMNFPSGAQFASTCSTWNISGKYHYKPLVWLLKSRKFSFSHFLTSCILRSLVSPPLLKMPGFSIKLNGGKNPPSLFFAYT